MDWISMDWSSVGTALGWVLAALMALVGVAGTVLPVLPGAPLVFVAALLAAWLDDFQHLDPITLGLLALLTVGTVLVDLFSQFWATRKINASREASWGSLLGGLVGLFYGLPGIILGPLLGASGGELLATGNWRQAGKVGLMSAVTYVLATVLKLILVLLMLGLCLARWIWP